MNKAEAIVSRLLVSRHASGPKKRSVARLTDRVHSAGNSPKVRLRYEQLLTEIPTGIDLLTPGQVTRIYFSLAPFLAESESRFYFNQRHFPTVLLLLQRLPPEKRADGLIALLKIIPQIRDSMDRDLPTMSDALSKLTQTLSETDAERCYAASTAMLKTLSDANQIAALVPIVRDLGTRLTPGAAKSSFEQLRQIAVHPIKRSSFSLI